MQPRAAKRINTNAHNPQRHPGDRRWPKTACASSTPPMPQPPANFTAKAPPRKPTPLSLTSAWLLSFPLFGLASLLGQNALQRFNLLRRQFGLGDKMHQHRPHGSAKNFG
jgi:hypothetical protein